jgi:ABC-type multidrug transport system ATPase subunit
MIIDVQSLTKRYSKEKTAIKNINLTLASPCVVGLVGPNGAGKTTLLKLLVRQLAPSSGSIRINGEDLASCELNFKTHLGYLPQEFGLYEELTVYQFLEYMALLKGVHVGRKERIEHCIKETGLLREEGRVIKTLSGGQKQRVGIAQALLNEPEIFIIDEPTVGLDPAERVRFRNLLSEIASDKIIILSTHIIEDVESVCNRLIVINYGEILFDGKVTDLIQKSEGHVGVMECPADKNVSDLFKTGKEENKTEYFITSQTAIGMLTKYRIVAKSLPDEVKRTAPSLEDAYMYLISTECNSF